MRVLFDQGTPVPLRQFLTGHAIRTAAEEHWTTLANGLLLDAAEAAGFELLLTTDKNIRYQQNLAGRRIAIVVLAAKLACRADSRRTRRRRRERRDARQLCGGPDLSMPTDGQLLDGLSQ